MSYVRRESLSRYRVASAIHGCVHIIEVILHSSYLITLVTGASRERGGGGGKAT